MSKEATADNIILGYKLANESKLERAIYGHMASQGSLEGGVGADASDEQIIAEYDRLGGLILNKDGYKVKTGSFYNFDRKVRAAHKEPQVTLIFKDLNGTEVEVPEDEPLPMEVRAAQMAAKVTAGKGKKGKKADIEDEDEE